MDARGPLQTRLARAAIAREIGQAAERPAVPDWLGQPGAVFVTLTQRGQLRGCIGSLEAHRPLLDDLEANARAAAFGDPRFPPLQVEELPHTRVEVSILSRPEPMNFADEADAVAQLRPGIDGVILEWHRQRGTFLPQVWDQLPDPAQFMRHLKQKAGLPADFWADDLHLARYMVEKFKESP
jgi:AmmeMemoRadiSam system protein A